MDLEQLNQIEDCMALALRIKKELRNDMEDISSCVGPRVVRAYRDTMDNAIDQITSIQKNLALLQQRIG